MTSSLGKSLNSFKLQSLNYNNTTRTKSFLVRIQSSLKAATTSININRIYNPMFQEFSTTKPMVSQILVKIPHPGQRTEADTMEKEIEAIIQNLKQAVERIKEKEINRLKSGSKLGELSNADMILVEEMSEEIVRRFLEKAVKYLMCSSCSVNLKDRIMDVKSLLGMLNSTI